MCEAAAQLGLFGLHCLDTGAWSQILWLDSFLWRKVQNLTPCLVMRQISAIKESNSLVQCQYIIGTLLDIGTLLYFSDQLKAFWYEVVFSCRIGQIAYTRKWIHLSHLFMMCFFTRTKIPITSQPVGRLKWYMTYLSLTLEISKGRF